MSLSVPRLLEALGIEARKRRGMLHALCPSHKDSRASWAIVDAPGERGHGRHKCMSCGYRGDAVDLVRTVLGLVSRSVAKEWAEKHAGEESAVLPARIRVEVSPIVVPAFQLPAGAGPVSLLPEGEFEAKALAYLRGRRILDSQIERWSICHAAEGRLAGRVVFPACDRDGRLLSYTARTYLDDPVRYKMPRAEEGADPGAIFGERWWPAQGARKVLFLAEGAVNALAVERQLMLLYPDAGWAGVGAVGGSEIALEQLLKIGTWHFVVLVRDGDGAGKKLARAVRGALARTGEVRIARMPPGEDAADVEARAPEALRMALLGVMLGDVGAGGSSAV